MSSPSEPSRSVPPPAIVKQPWSLRTELLIGQLVVLSLVVLGFGCAIYGLMRQSIYREAESDLLGAAQLIAEDLRSGNAVDELEIARAYRHRFGPAPRDHAYFAIWNATGAKLGGSDPLPPHVVPFPTAPPTDGPRPFATLAHGDNLEVAVRGPNGGQVLVGRPLAKEHDRLRRLALVTCFVGLLALAIGAAAAWWLARRIVRPLETLTTTIEQVSARKLDGQVEVAGASRELVRLASVFEGMLTRLRESFERQVRFTADASHELRTPVSVITTQTEHSLARPRSAEEYTVALETCGRAARRMQRLVDDLLLLARADSGRLELKLRTADLAEIARAALASVAPLAEQLGVRIAAQMQATLLEGDPERLERIIVNLVTNAVRYNRSQGEVFVGVYTRGDRAVLTVADQGIGIAADARHKIFERFYRADEAREFREGFGTGLGLSIVREIVAAHGGTIDFVSTAGQGTTFTVELPLHHRT